MRWAGILGTAMHPVCCNRRDALLWGAALVARSAHAQGERKVEKRQHPHHAVTLPVVGLGTWQTFDVEHASAVAPLLQRFVELGGTAVDCSPMYGRAETVLGQAAQDTRTRAGLFMATKVWTHGRAEGQAQMDRSFRNMRVATVDLMQVHNLLDWNIHLDTMERYRDQGRIRFTGITHYHAGAHADLVSVLKKRKVDFVQVNLSMAEPQAGSHVLPAAADAGVAVIINRPFAEGALFRRVKGRPPPPWAADVGAASWAQFFLKYILSFPQVTCVIPATGKVRHLEDNMAAGSGPVPDPAQRARMVAWLEAG